MTHILAALAALLLSALVPSQTVQGTWHGTHSVWGAFPHNSSCVNMALSGYLNPGHQPPVIGQTLGLQVTNTPSVNTGTWALMMAVAHESEAFSPPVYLDDLDIYGWLSGPPQVACIAWVPTDVTYSMTVPPWYADDYTSTYFYLAVPNDSYLVGELFVFQAVVFNSNMTGGLGTSWCMAGTIGDY